MVVVPKDGVLLGTSNGAAMVVVLLPGVRLVRLVVLVSVGPGTKIGCTPEQTTG